MTDWKTIKNCPQAKLLGVGECESCHKHDKCWKEGDHDNGIERKEK